MSGGHWQYAGGRIRMELEAIAEDLDGNGEAPRRWPMTCAALAGLAEALHAIEHEMDWDLSSDSRIDDDGMFDRASVGRLLEVPMKAAPDEWFPRGKWATIQAIQGRIDQV